MKKESIAYIFTFFLVLLAITFVVSYTDKAESLDNFQQVTIENGDSLWEIAERFQDKSNISRQDFVKWVQDNNNLHSTLVKPGDIVFVPIEKKHNVQLNQLASE
ncbi:cell division suppressor protein YneA [Metabacillus sp. HB246100]|uniref:cell division suppressor protein YneA n=1 Tax=Bacillus weihaiensis TaxID=1547283 RepID=UPI0023565148|nr:LysM peptidoglycan-binding domain-containing protein [Bacillus weihaiensis]